MSAFLARAWRHVGFQIGAVLLLLFVGTALVSVLWTPHPIDALNMRAKLMPSSNRKSTAPTISASRASSTVS